LTQVSAGSSPVPGTNSKQLKQLLMSFQIVC